MAWTGEDKFILNLLFVPEKVKSIPTEEGSGTAMTVPDLDWSVFLEKARREGVSAVIFHHLRKHGLEGRIPSNIYAALSQDYHANLKRNLLIVGALRKILAEFQEAGISCIVLKGIALVEFVYPNIAMRGMADVDLLIPKEALFRVDVLLSSMGYLSRDGFAAQAVNNPSGYLASLEYRKDPPSPLNLHLHWHPVNTSVPATAFIHGIDLDRIWAKALPVSLADSQALMLCPEHLIAYLCEHALRVGHSFDRLILLCDLFFAIKAFEGVLDWQVVQDESRRLGLSRFAYHGLTIARGYTGLPIPEACLAQLKPSDLSWGERLFLHLQRRNRRIRGSSYFIYLTMNREPFSKIGFITRTFFPPRPILLQRQHRKDTPFSKLLYRFRIREILSHISRELAHGRTKK
jgi:hypothetical protein